MSLSDDRASADPATRRAARSSPPSSPTAFSQTADQPSTQFASFSMPEVTEVGIELDRKLAALLDALDVPVPNALTA